jgi:hypothetical protein
MRKVHRQNDYTIKASLLGTGVVVISILCFLIFLSVVIIAARLVFG